MKNKILVFIVIILCFVSAGLGAYIYVDSQKVEITNDENTENVIKSSKSFINELFKASEGVLDYSTGTVRRNLDTGLNKLPEHDVTEVICSPEYVSEDFATVNTTVEYMRADGSVDVDFYKFYLIKENEKYLIYDLVNNVVFDNSTLDDIEISTSGLTDTLNAYFEDINNNKLSDSSHHLIGKAKSDHVRSFEFVSKAMGVLDYDISDIKHDIISGDTGRLVVVKSNYLNNSKDVSIISTLFKTNKGWKIYEIKQI